jgi:hypothetical protein
MRDGGSIIAAALGGFILAAVLVINAISESNNRAVESGLFTHNGRAFRLVEIKP